MRKEKIRPTDFNVSELPRTRFEQFKDIFKHQFLNMVKISTLQAVFNMPFIVWCVLFFLYLVSVEQDSVFTIIVYGGALLIPCIVIANIGLTGSFYCMKKLAYGGGLFAASSFFVGMKEEWKKGLFTGFLQGITCSAVLIGCSFLGAYVNSNGWFVGLGITLLIILLLVMTMVNYYSLAQSACYSNKLSIIIKNSFLMGLMRFPKHLLLLLLHPGLMVIFVAGSYFIPYAGQYISYASLLLFVFLNSFGILAWMLFILTSFDKFINKENYPEYVGKGLFVENKED